MAKKLAKAQRASARRKSTRTSSGKRRPTSSRTKSPPAADKRKGGPVPGTPSPMRTRLSVELHDHARRQFEQTEQFASTIALDCGVDESVIRRMALREGWVRYVAPPRDLPPVAKLLAQVEELEKVERVPQCDGENAEQDATQNIARFTQVVMAHLDEFEAMRRDGRLTPKAHLTTARAISILTEAFNKLQRLRAAQPGQNYDDLSQRYADRYDLLPADLDDYRLELTRRIEEFLRSRPAAGVDSQPAVGPAEGV